MTPYTLGYIAFEAGKPFNSCPYGDPLLSSRGKAQRWAKGWKDAKMDAQQGKKRKLPKG